jgi:beta-mannanase
VLGRNATQFVSYYPGDEAVDWLALDGYNWGRRRWRNRWASFDAVFAQSYRAMLDLAPEKPLMLAEVGCANRGGDKASWMRDALLDAVPNRYPAIRAVVWFNQNRPDHADWRVDSSPEALRAWQQAATDPRYSLTGPELLHVAGNRRV